MHYRNSTMSYKQQEIIALMNETGTETTWVAVSFIVMRRFYNKPGHCFLLH